MPFIIIETHIGSNALFGSKNEVQRKKCNVLWKLKHATRILTRI